MKILYVHQYFNTDDDAGSTRSYHFAKALVERGHKVIMLTSNRNNPALPLVYRRSVDGIEVIYVKNYYSNKMKFFKRIISFLKFAFASLFISLRLRYIDLVFATSTPLTVGIVGVVLKRLRKIPFVFEVRDLWPELAVAMKVVKNRLVIALSSWFEKKVYQSSDHIISLAPGITRGIVGRGYDRKNVSLIPNCSDREFFEKYRNGELRNWTFKEEDFVLTYAGTHGLANGLEWVIEIAREAMIRGENRLKFVLIGDGMQKSFLMNRKKELGLDNVIFFDPMPKTRLVPYILASDMCMQILANVPAFYYGTSPNKFFDYLAAGKPVLVNYPGWIADLVNEWGCGIAVDPENPDDFFSKIGDIINDRTILEQMGANSLRLLEKYFERRRLSKQFAYIIESVFKNCSEKVYCKN